MKNERTSYFKRALVMLMAVMMVFTYMPSMAWAYEPENSANSIPDFTVSSIETVDGGTIERTSDNAYTVTLAPDQKNLTLRVSCGGIDGEKYSKALEAYDKCQNEWDYTKADSNSDRFGVIECALFSYGKDGEEYNYEDGEVVKIEENSYCCSVETSIDLSFGNAMVWKLAVGHATEDENSDGMVYEYNGFNKKQTYYYTITIQREGGLDSVATDLAGSIVSKQGSNYIVRVPLSNTSVDLTMVPALPESATVYVVNGDAETQLNKTGSSGACQHTVSFDTGENEKIVTIRCKYTVNGGQQSIDNTITVSKLFEGVGTAENPYQLKKAEDLVKLREIVDSGYTFESKYFKLMNDITLPTDWTPIGCLSDKVTEDAQSLSHKAGDTVFPFSGKIDGGVYDTNGKLTGKCTLTVPEGGKPLLGYVLGAEVKNLDIKGTKINGYGLVNDLHGVGMGGSAIVIDNVTLKSGSSTLKSGFIGAEIDERFNGEAGCSMNFNVTIRNCEIEEGVTVGYNADQSEIGSIAGRINGTVENCKSYATVKGKDYVGGIIGMKDNSMGSCTVTGCTFGGTVEATGDNVGGIIGSHYQSSSAPNAIRTNVTNCQVTGNVTGENNVGGILGGDEIVAQAWNAYSIAGNSFSGKISGKKNVGGIIGYYRSLNKWDNIAGNYYTKDCGASKGIGAVQYVDTDQYANMTVKDGVTYFNTAKMEDRTKEPYQLYLYTNEGKLMEGPYVEGCDWKPNYNRTDDPLGTGASRLAEAVDTIPTTPVCYALNVEGTVKDQYVGGNLDLSGLTFTAKWTNNQPDTTVEAKDITVSGYNKYSNSVQNITLSYGNAQTILQVAVKQKASGDTTKDKLTVNFTLLGDNKHDSDTDKKVHGLATGGLTTWVAKTSYEVPLNSTVWDLMKQVQTGNSKVKFNTESTQYGTYIYSVTYNGTELGEFDNGKNSGWMYTVNGTHPEVGVSARYLNNGDSVVFHYTDDYTKEEGSEKWNSGTKTEETKTVTTDTKTGTVTTPTETKVTEKTNADGTKEKTVAVTVSTNNQTEIIKQATDKKSAEIVLEVASTATNGAQNVQLQLNVSFVKNVSEKTDAALTVNTENGTVSLDQDTIKTVLDEAKGATITLDVNKVANPTEVQKKAAGTNGQILSLTVKSGDKTISDFKTGKVTVTVAISTALQNKRVAAIHIAEDGKIEQMPGKSREVGGKKCFEFTTSHFSDFALVDADELGLETEDEIDAAALVAKLTPVARSAKTAKGYIKVTTSLDKSDKAIISELKDAGYTVKYRFYRSTKKSASYKAALEKTGKTYTNTTGKKGTKYYYKARVMVYDADGALVAKSELKQCKYACRIK